MKCEVAGCNSEKVCFLYCPEHHKTICVDAKSDFSRFLEQKSLQERLDRTVLLHYLEKDMYKIFAKVSKEVFVDEIDTEMLDRTSVHRFDKSNLYRLADKRTLYLAKNGTILGEVWEERNAKSYWLRRV